MERLVVLSALLLLALSMAAAAWGLKCWALGHEARGLYWIFVSLLSGGVCAQLLRYKEVI